MRWNEEIRALAAAAKAVNVSPDDDERLAFNLEADAPEQARAIERDLIGGLGGLATARPLFDAADDPDLGRFTRLEFPGIDAEIGAPIAYDLAYSIADSFGLVSAEPDLPTHFYFLPGEGAPRDDAESAIVSAFCEVGGDPPPDKLWAVDMVRAREAIAYSRSQGRPEGGAGVLVAQPDTGVVVPNPDLESGALDAGLGWDLMLDQVGARDPLNYKGNKGHGTATSSVVASRPGGAIHGTAPSATVYPIRCIKTVVVVTAKPVARAIEKAVAQGANVITMSLGGVPSRAVRTAVRKATKAGVIVLAAAGNCVRLVVWPARYSDCIAVAGCNFFQQPWKGSCRGEAVDITAPGEQVWHASATDPRGFDDGQGTSFAVAITAGAAAQWLAHHGVATVKAEAQRRKVEVQALFRRALQETAAPAADLPKNQFGPGILNIEELLRKPLGAIGPVVAEVDRPGDDPGDATPPEYLEILREFGPDAETAQIDWRRYGAEIGQVALRRSISARAEGVELAESAPAASADDLQQAADRSGNQALKRLLGQD